MSGLLHIQGRVSTLAGGLTVRRILPAAQRRSVGPFVFFDHFGPVTLAADVDSDVGAHPHIGLATVTYLFAGSMMHRDSLGTVQAIRPGAVNWMTAGRGIVHSERATPEERGHARTLHGLQLWVALPPALEDMEPGFLHVPATDIPVVNQGSAHIRVLVGQAFDRHSSVSTASETLYLDIQLPANAVWTLPALAPEMAIYAPEQALVLNDHALPAQHMAVLPSVSDAVLRTGSEAVRFVVIGGAPLEQPVRMWWNFVSTDRQKIARAARRWEADGFDRIPGETQRIGAPPWVD